MHDAHQHKIVLSKLNYSFYSTEEGLYIYECGCWKGLLYISMKGRDLLFTYLKPLRPLIKRINDAVGWKVTYLFLAMTAGIIVAWRFFYGKKKPWQMFTPVSMFCCSQWLWFSWRRPGMNALQLIILDAGCVSERKAHAQQTFPGITKPE